MSSPRRRVRLLAHPLLSALLLGIWLLASNRISPGLLLLGAALAVAIPLITHADRGDAVRVRIVPLAGLLAVLLVDIVIANLRVAVLILGPASRLRPQFITVPLDVQSAAGIAALTSIVSLTPGTVSCSIRSDRSALVVHGLDVADEATTVAAIKSRYERRIMAVFR